MSTFQHDGAPFCKPGKTQNVSGTVAINTKPCGWIFLSRDTWQMIVSCQPAHRPHGTRRSWLHIALVACSPAVGKAPSSNDPIISNTYPKPCSVLCFRGLFVPCVCDDAGGSAGITAHSERVVTGPSLTQVPFAPCTSGAYRGTNLSAWSSTGSHAARAWAITKPSSAGL